MSNPMYPFFRLAKTIIQSKKQPTLSYTQQDEIQFRCHPWDIDLFLELNNGRILTLYDLGRTALSVKCGLMSTLKKERWGLVVAGSSVRYRKRIHMFDKITMKTQCVATDDKWFYLEQSMWVKGEPCSSVLIRAGVTSKQGIVAPLDVVDAAGVSPADNETPQWVQEWVDSEQHRPWPPSNLA
ncbi:acyl-CoA thioesterase [Vibrio sp. La 4.2.2]|uniref:acyl-CoA thioesterase n=1 Tax=Vibrio sp. La 4.2.2 TaxID=2998830 RepID=UPI0022CDBFE4|nr:acyl-CoA thioesterase [Vibrio sp. La 4.2.2]MDA0107087.1 acyl-CoA thioesterase [Vibrio sp. La 4.2.2]